MVDPGVNKALLLAALEKRGLSVAEIDMVYLTHYHPDHALLAGWLFGEGIPVVDYETIYDKDLETEFEGKIPGTAIEIVLTPGHAHEHSSLLVKTEKRGVVALAGDVWWWLDEDRQLVESAEQLFEHGDPFVKDEEALRESRKKLLDKADWIIPGHGEIFENPVE